MGIHVSYFNYLDEEIMLISSVVLEELRVTVVYQVLCFWGWR